MPEDLVDAWRAAAAELAERIPPQYREWLHATRLVGRLGDAAVLAAPNEFARYAFDTHLRPLIIAALAERIGYRLQLMIAVEPGGPAATGIVVGDAPPERLDRTSRPDLAPVGTGRLNPRYTFEQFTVGASNRFAHAAAMEIADSPGKVYNPLVIYGGRGLGKTHLLHAIGHRARHLGTARDVRYVPAAQFADDRHRDADLLLVDDIHLLPRRERVRDDFLHTFDALHSADRQIVIGCDRPPRRLSTVDRVLIGQFEWGLLADLQPPDPQTRVAILRQKAAQTPMAVPADVIDLLAARFTGSIRELEGALAWVVAVAGRTGSPLDVALAEGALLDLVAPWPRITVDHVIAAAADHYRITPDDLCGQSRSRGVTHARHVAMYVCRELTDLSLPAIGQAFGGRDATTVMHGVDKIRTQVSKNAALRVDIGELIERTKATAADSDGV
jgi:chromosomal replication initiator protein